MIHETGFDDTFYYFGNERQIRDWPIVREFYLFVCVGREDISETRATRPIFTKRFMHAITAVARFSRGVALYLNMYFRFTDDVIFAHKGPYEGVQRA